MRTKKSGLACVGVLLLCLSLAALAQTTDEYYQRAENQYFIGNNKEAVELLRKSLDENPNNEKAKALLTQIQTEAPEEAAPGESTTAPVSTVTSIVTTTTQPVMQRAPQIIVTKTSKFKVRRETAHDLLAQGEEYYNKGEYNKAKGIFDEVLVLMPGHKNTIEYIRKIKYEVPKTARPGSIAATVAGGTVVGHETRFVILNVLLLIIVALVIFLAAKIGRGIWVSNHAVCSECEALNSLDAEFCKKCGARLKTPQLTDEQKEWFGKFHWEKNPFTLSVVSDVFTGHKTEIAMIVEKLNTLSGHVLVIGGLGTGKSTLLQWLEKGLKDRFETIYVMRPPVTSEEMINLIAATLSGQTNHTKKYSMYEFQELCKKYNRNILILIDEAHEINEQFEQFMRTLGDLPNVFLVMAGLPQAREKIKRDMPALFDRIVESVLLGGLNQEETRELITKRITNAGGAGLGPFTAAAVDKIYDISYGIPRRLLKICDWLVTKAIRSNKLTIDVSDVDAYMISYNEDIMSSQAKKIEEEKEKIEEREEEDNG